jgi:hypothetical protein
MLKQVEMYLPLLITSQNFFLTSSVLIIKITIMKKNILKKITVLAILCFTLLFTNAQIGQKMKAASDNSLTGTWICNNGGQPLTLVLFSNNKGEFEGDEITYVQTDNKLTIKTSATSTTYTFKLSGNNLTLSGGDLSKPAVFSKSGGQSNEDQIPAKTAPKSFAGNELIGTWIAEGIQFTFKEGGLMMYNDKTMEYTVQGKTLYCQNDQAGVSVTYQYEINQNYLMLKNNGNTIMLQKKTGGNYTNQSNNGNAGNNKPPFLGYWISAENEHLTLMEGGQMKLESYDLTYTYDATTFTVNAPSGSVVFRYKLNGNILTCVAPGGKISTYQKQGVSGTNGNSNQRSVQGGLDQSMVGKWCSVSTSSGGYNTSGSYSSSECFVLESNGTYAYSSGSSRSVDAGSSASQGDDRGTWSVQGNVLIARSQNGTTSQYNFVKRNSANGDPCLVIEGKSFVTYYSKPSWR